MSWFIKRFMSEDFDGNCTTHRRVIIKMINNSGDDVTLQCLKASPDGKLITSVIRLNVQYSSWFVVVQAFVRIWY